MFDPTPSQIAELSPDQEDLGLRLFLAGLEESQFKQQVACFEHRSNGSRCPAIGFGGLSVRKD